MTQFLEFLRQNNRWVQTEYDDKGRPIRRRPPDPRRPRYYDGDVPSGGSWSSEPEDD